MSLYYSFLDLLDIDFYKDRLESNPENVEPDMALNITELVKNIVQQEAPILGQTTPSVFNHSSVDDILLNFAGATDVQEAPVTPVLSTQIDVLTEVFGPIPRYSPSKDPLADFLKSHNNVTASIKSKDKIQEEVPPVRSLSPSDATKKMSTTAFDDLLVRHGLSPSSRTLKTLESMSNLTVSTDPLQHKIGQWSKGKETNIRALLCSLHEILWDGADQWTRPSISDLLGSCQVKRWYKKACLVVHPDKQVGTGNELLAKSIFTQLNIAWVNQKNL